MKTHFECGLNAFPDENYRGMTLRDYFAAKAMQAFIVKGVIPANGLSTKQAVVNMAYETADEMLKTREA
jgi:hypothetical protein